ncbi:DnaJ domain-containing protein [Ensifer soli]|uniref:DnaJ domain-containing protein n=1 Tax=Ciceribacter sp. sgz301302 TaxID=3342379 RepID=UPI0035B95180
MIDPYEILGLPRDADTAAVRAAFRRRAKTAHPDTGGQLNDFERLKNASDLLTDPVRRKVYDDTGYDPALADPKDMKGVMILETYVNDLILDERSPGSFDPLAAIRRKLADEMVGARFHILEMERHRARVRDHIGRIGRPAGVDVLGSLMKARAAAITEAIARAEAEIAALEKAYALLEGYSYTLEIEQPKAAE